MGSGLILLGVNNMKYIKISAMFLVLVAILLIATSEFTIKLDLVCCKKSIEGTDFRPLACQILHNEKHLENIMQYHKFIKDINFDFENYSYLITFGKAAKCIKYSIYDTIFNDSSPSYCKLIWSGRLKANIIYKDNDRYDMYRYPMIFKEMGDGYIHIYKFNKSVFLSKEYEL